MNAESLEILNRVFGEARNQNDFDFDFWQDVAIKNYKLEINDKQVWWTLPDVRRNEITFIFTSKETVTFNVDIFKRAVCEFNEISFFLDDVQYTIAFYEAVRLK